MATLWHTAAPSVRRLAGAQPVFSSPIQAVGGAVMFHFPPSDTKKREQNINFSHEPEQTNWTAQGCARKEPAMNFGNKWQRSGIMSASGGQHRTDAKTASARVPRKVRG